MNEYCIASVIWRSINSLILTIIAIYMIYQGIRHFCISNNSQTKKINKCLKCTYLIYTISVFALAPLSCMFYCFVSREAQSILRVSMGFIYWHAILPCLAIMFAFRLYITFKDSAYALTKLEIILLCSLMFITFCCYGIASMILIVNHPSVPPICHFMIIIGYAIYLLLSIVILVLFINKLTALVLVQTQLVNDVNADIQVSSNQKRLINVISKYLTLYSVAFLTTIAVLGAQISASVINDYHHELVNLFYTPIFQYEIMTNAVCVYLSFTFAGKKYRSVCLKLDRCFYKMFIRQTTQHIRKSICNDTNIMVTIINSPDSQE